MEGEPGFDKKTRKTETRRRLKNPLDDGREVCAEDQVRNGFNAEVRSKLSHDKVQAIAWSDLKSGSRPIAATDGQTEHVNEEEQGQSSESEYD